MEVIKMIDNNKVEKFASVNGLTHHSGEINVGNFDVAEKAFKNIDKSYKSRIVDGFRKFVVGFRNLMAAIVSFVKGIFSKFNNRDNGVVKEFLFPELDLGAPQKPVRSAEVEYYVVLKNIQD